MEDIRQVFTAGQFEKEMNMVVRHIRKIFSAMKCSVESHQSSPTSFCVGENCAKRLLCPECLVKDVQHTQLHQSTTMTLNQYLETVFVFKVDDYLVNQFKVNEVVEFYEMFWKGLNLVYKVARPLTTGKLHQLLREAEERLQSLY